MKPIEEQTIGVWVGLDWADQEHAYALRMSGSSEIETGDVKQTPEALQSWINGLRERSGGGWVAIAVEQSRGALLYALMDYDFVLIYPINPKSLSRYRGAFYPSGGKDDPRDADLVLDYLLKHRERIRLWEPESPEVRSLRLLSEQRRKLVDLRADLTNQWTANLKNYFPQALKWVGPLKGKTACDFLNRWPSLEALQRVKPTTIRRFLKSHRVGGSEKLHSKLEEIKQARALTHDAAIVTAASLMTQSLAGQILHLNESIQRFDAKIEELFNHHPDHFIFSSLPGSGKALGPRLLTLFGEGSFPMRRGGTDRLRHRPPAAKQWQDPHRVLPLGLSQVRPPGRSRIRRSLPALVPLGASVLPDAAQPRERSSRRGALFGLQVAAHNLPLLEEPGPLRRRHLCGFFEGEQRPFAGLLVESNQAVEKNATG